MVPQYLFNYYALSHARTARHVIQELLMDNTNMTKKMSTMRRVAQCAVGYGLSTNAAVWHEIDMGARAAVQKEKQSVLATHTHRRFAGVSDIFSQDASEDMAEFVAQMEREVVPQLHLRLEKRREAHIRCEEAIAKFTAAAPDVNKLELFREVS